MKIENVIQMTFNGCDWQIVMVVTWYSAPLWPLADPQRRFKAVFVNDWQMHVAAFWNYHSQLLKVDFTERFHYILFHVLHHKARLIVFLRITITISDVMITSIPNLLRVNSCGMGVTIMFSKITNLCDYTCTASWLHIIYTSS